MSGTLSRPRFVVDEVPIIEGTLQLPSYKLPTFDVPAPIAARRAPPMSEAQAAAMLTLGLMAILATAFGVIVALLF